MTTVPTHALVGAALRPVFPARTLPHRAWLAGALCAMAPDLDGIGLRLGIPYGHFLGHRGLSHSLLCAGVFGVTVALVYRRRSAEVFSTVALAIYLTLCTATHGLLDGITNGGLGIAFLSPFDTTRYFLPWRPLEVSPLGLDGFLSARGLEVLASEARWVWLPCAVLLAVGFVRRRGRRSAEG